jgi:uncharacterized C2H2 Zn-finger protein
MVHEFTIHRTEARWRCNLCAETFQTQEQLRAHIDNTHKIDFMPSQIPEVIAASKRLEMRDGSDELCPFCPVAPFQTQKAFASHLGKHLQEISLAALSFHGASPDNGSDNEDDENDEDDDINEEHASVQSCESRGPMKDYADDKNTSTNHRAAIITQYPNDIDVSLHNVTQDLKEVSFASEIAPLILYSPY